MKTIAFFLSVFLGLAISAFAQNNYVEGYVITNQNDTVRGFVNDRNWEKNPRIISFKTSLSGDAVKYSPTDIIGFYSKSSNEYYQSYIGKVDDSVDESGKRLSVKDDAEFFQKDYTKTDTIFLRAITKGVLNLYQYTDLKGRVHFFAQRGEMPITELISQEYLILQPEGYVSTSSARLVRKNEVYRKQLMAILTDCDNSNEKIKTAEYTKKSLQKLAATYYACINKQATYTHKGEGSKMEFGIVVGGAISSLRIVGPYGPGNYGSSINPIGGLSFNFVFPRNREAWSLYGDVMWRHFSFSKDVPSLIDTIPLKLSSGYLKFDVLIRYTLPTRTQKIRPFINIGVATNLELYSTQNIFSYSRGTGYKYETRNYERGLLIGTGFRVSKMQCEIRYERGNGMSPLVGVASPVKNWYLLLSYWFK